MNTENNTENTNTETTVIVATKPVKAAKKVSKNKTVNKNNKAKAIIKTRAQVAAANGKCLGRPKGSTGACIVNLQDLISKLPPTSQVPVSRRWLNLLNLGISTQNIVSNTKTLTEISQQYKQSSVANVIDLNSPAPVEEALAA